jgi:hypothetical protein
LGLSPARALPAIHLRTGAAAGSDREIAAAFSPQKHWEISADFPTRLQKSRGTQAAARQKSGVPSVNRCGR